MSLPESSRRLKVWFIDDQHDNLRCWLNSFPEAVRSAHDFAVFDNVPTLFSQLDAGEWPDILFIDYYIGEHSGQDVVTYFEVHPQRPFLIAHSSMARANEYMLSLGADMMLSKVPGASYTLSIVDRIHSDQDLFRLLNKELL